MNRYKKFSLWYRTTIVPLCSVAAVLIRDYLVSEHQLGSELAIAAVLIVAVVLIRIFETLLTALLNLTLLRKILFGRDFIEGYWLDTAATEEKEEEIEHAIVINIRLIDERFRLSGET